MAVHESSVNYENLINDLAEMYPWDVDEVVITELVANALDAGATRIMVDFDPSENVLVVEDNGEGMTHSQFREYHDFAADLKKRGTGIGFAGVGAKISFNIAYQVLTETNGRRFSGGSDWYWHYDRLLWEELGSTHLKGTGTRVAIQFRKDAKLAYSTSADLISLLRRHFLPLMDADFLNQYDQMSIYSSDLRFVVNGRVVEPTRVTADFALDKVKKFHPLRAGNPFGFGVFGLSAVEHPFDPQDSGVLLCTYGKVIRTDLFSQFPGSLGPRLFGMVEVPDFIRFLTTSKTDFSRRGKHKAFERLYGPIRQEFKSWLKSIGAQPTQLISAREAARLEKELKRIFREIPELAGFFGVRAPRSGPAPSGVARTGGSSQGETGSLFTVGNPASGTDRAPSQPVGQLTQTDLGPPAGAPGPSADGITVQRVPRIAFAEVPHRVELAWVEGDSVVINAGHPAYAKSYGNTVTRRLHSLLAISSAIQRFLESEGDALDRRFLDRVMAAWGQR